MFTALITPERLSRRTALFAGLALLFSFFVPSCAAAQARSTASARGAAPMTVRIGPITSADPNLGKIVRETLLTDLAKSSRLTVLGTSGSNRPAGAVYTLTGSCLFNRDSVIINLRMVNSAGRSVPGAAENIEGPRPFLFRLVQALAGKFAARMVGGPSRSVARPASPKKAPQIARARPVPPAVKSDDVPDFDPSLDMEEPLIRTDELGRVPERGREPDARPSEDRSVRYTGVIVDCRGLWLERSMSPRIRRTDGSTVYDGANSTPDFAIEKGVVGYATSMAQARDLDRAGARPLVIEALDRHRQPLSGDPILSDDDAEFLVRAARKDGFLKKFNVVFLIDR